MSYLFFAKSISPLQRSAVDELCMRYTWKTSRNVAAVMRMSKPSISVEFAHALKLKPKVLEYTREGKTELWRRISWGGPVYHDDAVGGLSWTKAYLKKEVPRRADEFVDMHAVFRDALGSVQVGLESLGIKTVFSYPYLLAKENGKMICAAALAMSRDLGDTIMIHGYVPFEVRPEWRWLLNYSEDSMTSVGELAPQSDREKIFDAMVEGFAQSEGANAEKLPQEFLSGADVLVKEVYGTRDWLFEGMDPREPQIWKNPLGLRSDAPSCASVKAWKVYLRERKIRVDHCNECGDIAECRKTEAGSLCPTHYSKFVASREASAVPVA